MSKLDNFKFNSFKSERIQIESILIVIEQISTFYFVFLLHLDFTNLKFCNLQIFNIKNFQFFMYEIICNVSNWTGFKRYSKDFAVFQTISRDLK